MKIENILKKLGVEPINEESFKILIASINTILKNNDEDLELLCCKHHF